MVSLLVVFVSLLVNIILFYLMYKGVYIPSGKTPFIIGFVTVIIYWLIGRLLGEERGKRLMRMLIFSVSMYIPLSLSALVYHHWKMDAILSSLTMMKISLFILIAIVIYLNVVYIRAEISYKRKRGNQRIQKEPKKSQLQLWKERRNDQKTGKKEDISIQLGQSTEAEEQSPPV